MKILESASRNKCFVVGWFLISVMAVAVAYLMIISMRLRPLADDYCAALQANNGLLGAIQFWWSTWAGDLFGVTLFTLLTGLPILLLPVSVASAIPFVAVVISVAIVGLTLAWRLQISRSGVEAKRTWLTATLLVILGFAAAWIGYWWIPARDGSEFELGLAVSATIWPTVGTLYILPALMAILTLGIGLTASRRVWQFVGLVLGVLIGLSGLVLGLATVVTIVAWLLISALFGLGAHMHRSQNVRAGLVTMVGVIVGLGMAYLSPGTSARSQDQLQEFTPLIALNRTFPEAIFRLIDAYTSVGGIVTFLFFAGLGIVIARLNGKEISAEARSILLLLVIFNVASTSSSALSDGIVYVAVWHQVVPYIFTFFVASFGGLMLGHYVAGIGNQIQALLSVLATVAAVGLLTSINAFAGVAAEREAEWSVGAAPIGGISDIEEEQFRKCWEGIREPGDPRSVNPQ